MLSQDLPFVTFHDKKMTFILIDMLYTMYSVRRINQICVDNGIIVCEVTLRPKSIGQQM